MNKATPIVLLVVVLIAAGSSFVWFLNVPGGGVSYQQGSYNSTEVIVLYANAQGWNYNSSNPNPTLNEKLHTLLEFKVIEQDGLPHTLTIAAGPNETTNSNDWIVNVVIPTTVGSITWVNWSFANPGLYTYWCTVHPYTMVGKLYVNGTSNSTSSSPNASTVQVPSTSFLNAGIQHQGSGTYEMADNNEQVW
jgi:hypothetical protein